MNGGRGDGHARPVTGTAVSHWTSSAARPSPAQQSDWFAVARPSEGLSRVTIHVSKPHLNRDNKDTFLVKCGRGLSGHQAPRGTGASVMGCGCWGRVQELLDPPRLPAGPGLRADPKGLTAAGSPSGCVQAAALGSGPRLQDRGGGNAASKVGGSILVKGRVLGRSILGLVSGDGGQGKRQALKAGGLRLLSSDSKTRGAVTPAGSLGQGRVLGLSHTHPPRGVLPPGRLQPAGTLIQSPGFTECSEPVFQVRILLYKCGN